MRGLQEGRGCWSGENYFLGIFNSIGEGCARLACCLDGAVMTGFDYYYKTRREAQGGASSEGSVRVLSRLCTLFSNVLLLKRHFLI